jgi:protocatechuate 3,4-dioxygenase beta subunit
MNDHDPKTLTRREALGALAAVGAAFTNACGSSASPTSPSTTTTTTTSGGTTSAACAVAPAETAGPYPDKLGMITNAAFFRRDITEGRPGLPLTLTITVVNANNNCSPVANANVEVWQCDASGYYSEYSQPGYNGTGQTYLRGLQTTDANGQATFNTIYPGWYSGRATHIHVEIFVNGSLVKTTQIAFPEDVSAAVYATGVYASKGQNSTQNSTDGVFSDGTTDEMATLTGSTTTGYTATITFGINV